MRNPVIGGALGALAIYLYLEDEHKESDISLISAISVFVTVFFIVITLFFARSSFHPERFLSNH